MAVIKDAIDAHDTLWKLSVALMGIALIINTGVIVLEEQIQATNNVMQEKCTERFGNGNYTYIYTQISEPIASLVQEQHTIVKCKNRATGTIYEPEIILH